MPASELRERAVRERVEVVGVARREITPLLELEPPGFFGAVRMLMCEVDYLAALYFGFNGKDRRKISTPGKSVRFIDEVISQASGEGNYRRFAKHLYEMYRVGLVHLRAPKIVTRADASTPVLTWTLMTRRNRGVIIQVGSALAYRSIPLQSAYCASKHAIEGFTESLRSELIHQNSAVRLSIVNLPGVNTTQFIWTKNRMPHKPRPTGPIYQP